MYKVGYSYVTMAHLAFESTLSVAGSTLYSVFGFKVTDPECTAKLFAKASSIGVSCVVSSLITIHCPRLGQNYKFGGQHPIHHNLKERGKHHLLN